MFLAHIRSEVLLGVVRPLDTGAGSTRALGYLNHGGTLDAAGILFANRCTWAHAVAVIAEAISQQPDKFLDAEELLAVQEKGNPTVVMQP